MYRQYDWVEWDIKPACKNALNLTAKEVIEADFRDVYHYTDTIRCLKFEGVYYDDTFTPTTWLRAEEMQKIELTLMFTKSARDLTFSRMMRKPLSVMQFKVDEALGKINGEEDEYRQNLKFFVYSAHDDQVDDMMVWLDPTNYEMDYVLFSSMVDFELYQSAECMTNGAADESCFSVTIRYNGVELALSGCGEEPGCSFPDFVNYLGEIWYEQDISNKDLLNDACYQQYVPSEMFGFLN